MDDSLKVFAACHNKVEVTMPDIYVSTMRDVKLLFCSFFWS